MIIIRVYGLLINHNQQLLVSDELVKGKYITKFPGGGLQQGEGTIDCLKREFMEELQLPIQVLSHYYTTDFYQQSGFNPNHQIISIYYKVAALQPLSVAVSSIPFEYTKAQLELYKTTEQIEAFRYIQLTELTANNVTLPIDKVVVNRLLNNE